MAKRKKQSGNGGRSNRQVPPGVWNRGLGYGPANPIRVRTKRLDEISGDKIALAYWLWAKQIVEDGGDVPVTEAEARRVAAEFEAQAEAVKSKRPDNKKRSA